jgi:glutathione S-transferase
MIIVHHLNNSRSQRVLWALEELGVPYEIKAYQRDTTTNLAPAELKAVHRLGKSPVVVDDGRTIIESGAIIQYLLDRHGGGRLQPVPGSDAALQHLQWMHYAEGSGMLPLMLLLYTRRLGDAAAAPLKPRIDSEIANHLGYISGALGDKPFLLGADLTGADIQISFVMEVARAFRRLADYANLDKYLVRLQARPAYQRALERGGPYSMAA